MADAVRTAVWFLPEQADSVRAVAERAGLVITHAGTPDASRGAAPAEGFDAEPIDDLRGTLTAADVDAVYLATAPSDTDDIASAFLAAAQRDVRVIVQEPIPASALELAREGWTRSRQGRTPLDGVRYAGLPRLGRAFREAGEVLDQFGPVRSAAIECWGHPNDGTLGARMFYGLDLLVRLMDEPEQIDASYVGPAHGRTLQALPGDSLRGLRGDFTCNLRLSDGRSATLSASDQAGRWEHTATLIGAGGRLIVRESGFVWLDPDGRTADASRSSDHLDDRPAVSSIGDGIRRVLDPASPDPGPVDSAAVLATAHAALLSARTGDPESPATIRRLLASA